MDPNNLPVMDSVQAAIAAMGGVSGGLELEGRGSADYAYGAAAQPMPAELLIPDSDVQGLIAERQERGTGLYQIMRRKKLPAKNQKRTNYCWFFGPVQAVEIVRMLQNEEYVSLSPASGAAPLKGFRNVGGWGKDALEWLAKYGVCPSANWPDATIDRRYHTDENKALALNYRVTEWMELPRRSKRHWVSCVLRNTPVPAGYDEWRHEVVIVDAVWKNGRALPVIRNQWEGYGDDNYAVLDGWAEEPDDQVAPRVVIAA
jgi:hypothetical protein